jgi:hypothetical protein
MNKEQLNKELNELLGIEPELIYHMKGYTCNKEDLREIGSEYVNFKIYPGNRVKKVTKEYVDFFEPANFVKLLEIDLLLEGQIVFTAGYGSLEEQLITSVINKIKKYNTYLVLASVKAQQTEWER